MAVMGRLRQIGRNLFTKHLFITNTLSCGGLLGFGDAIQQVIEQRQCAKSSKDLFKEKPFDWLRTGRMTIVGLLSGPIFHGWYKFLDARFPARTAKVVAQKILLDECICSPVMIVVFLNGRMCVIGLILGPFAHNWYKLLDAAIPGRRLLRDVPKKILLDEIIAAPFFAFIFLSGMGVLEGHSKDKILADFKSKFWEIYLMDWLVWPPVQAFNFYVLPPQYRVIYVNVCTLAWDVFLSHVKHKDHILELPGHHPHSDTASHSSPAPVTDSSSSSSSSTVNVKYLKEA